jgi:hypothetical protein
MNLSDIRIVDLTSSVWDEKLSNPEKGEYEFSAKKYINYRGDGPRPDWFFTWERYTPTNGYQEVHKAKASGFSYVMPKVDPYWPEGIAPNAEGVYQFGDVVLMKCRLVDELERRWEKKQFDAAGGKREVDAFASSVRAGGGGEPIADYQSMLSKL